MTIGAYLTTVYSIGIVICAAILIWMRTDSGKKWLAGPPE